MSSSKKYLVFARDGAGAPLTGLSLAWISYWNLADDSSIGSPPAFTELGGGLYYFDPGLAPDAARAGVIDGGATAAEMTVVGGQTSASRYVPWSARYEDRNVATDVWAAATRSLTTDAGADVWGYGTRTLTALAGTPANDVWAAATRSLTTAAEESIAAAVWTAAGRTLSDYTGVWDDNETPTRTLSSGGNSAIATAVWAAVTRTLTELDFSGMGAESVSVQFTDGNVGVQGAIVEAINGSGTTIAVQVTDGAGNVTFLLDAGTYTLRAARPGYQWAATSVVVSSPDTIDTAIVVGSALTSAQLAQVGVSRTVAIGTKTRGAKIENVTQGDVLSLSRIVTGVPNGSVIASASIRFGHFGTKRTDLSIDAAVPDTGADGTGRVTFAMTAAQTRGFQARQPQDYQVRIVLDSGTEAVVEDGVIVFDPEID